VLDPWVNGKQHLGQKVLRKGECSFFLQPGERLESGIQNVLVLGEEEALLLKAKQTFVDNQGKKHVAGDRWMIYGPIDFVPPIEVEIVEVRKSIPLDQNEGVYVRDIKTGAVRAVIGESYMLKPNEELWKKELPKLVEVRI
jgi:major vault protein